MSCLSTEENVENTLAVLVELVASFVNVIVELERAFVATVVHLTTRLVPFRRNS